MFILRFFFHVLKLLLEPKTGQTKQILTAIKDFYNPMKKCIFQVLIKNNYFILCWNFFILILYLEKKVHL